MQYNNIKAFQSRNVHIIPIHAGLMNYVVNMGNETKYKKKRKEKDERSEHKRTEQKPKKGTSKGDRRKERKKEREWKRERVCLFFYIVQLP